jgi:hypothetical protein
MSIDKTKCCKTHTEEKEKSGECCQVDEQNPKTMALHELAKANPTLTYRQVEKLKEQYE